MNKGWSLTVKGLRLRDTVGKPPLSVQCSSPVAVSMILESHLGGVKVILIVDFSSFGNLDLPGRLVCVPREMTILKCPIGKE